MGMTENIMKDNLLYLEAWMNYNPRLKEKLSMENNILVFHDEEQIEKIDISSFYLPEMLYNENFREKVATELESEDLFQIIKLYIQTQEIFEKEQHEMQVSPKVVDILIKVDPQSSQEFIVLIDENKRKYRYDTKSPEQVINYYNELKERKGIVTLKELGSVIQNGI